MLNKADLVAIVDALTCEEEINSKFLTLSLKTRLFNRFFLFILEPMDIESKESETELTTTTRENVDHNHTNDHTNNDLNHNSYKPPEYDTYFNPSHKVSKYQFTLAVLVHLGVLDTHHDIVPWLNVSYYNCICCMWLQCICIILICFECFTCIILLTHLYLSGRHNVQKVP
jgi:hypothetical protein